MTIDEDGIDIKRNFIAKPIIDAIKKDVFNTNEVFPIHGIRNADKKFNSINTLAHSHDFLSLAKSILGSPPSIVRSLFFDKTPNKNWLVTWHQDKTIALNKKANIKGWGPWSLKDGIHHVQPPIAALEQMITFRLHLDDTDENNGCLRVITKSHKLGILSQDVITETTSTQKPFMCKAKEGDLLIMKPHLLHSSSKSTKPSHRRVVHIEYSNFKLPHDLKWV